MPFSRPSSPRYAPHSHEAIAVCTGAFVSKDEYEKALSSDRAKELLNEWFASYDVASISGVPAFVVSGKYLINLNAASSIDEMAKTIKELLDK